MKKKSVKARPKTKSKPSSSPAGYSGTPLPKKLGVHPGSRVGLVGAPPGFEALLEPLPPEATLTRSARATCDLWIWFPRTLRELDQRMAMRVEQLGANGIWICWPKKASGVQTDLSEALVRTRGLSAGLVDFKVCAIDATYSGLKLTRRKTPPGGPR